MNIVATNWLTTAQDQKPDPRYAARGYPKGALRFTVACLCISLFGSRFGLVIGGSQVSLVGPAVLALTFYAFMRGHFCFHKVRLAVFLLLCSLTIFSLAVNVVEPNRFGANLSWTSLLQFWLLSSLMVFRFTQPLDEKIFFSNINMVLAIVAIAGILQFIVQFGGIELFSFRDFLPPSFSYETGFNVQIPIGSTRYFKSNGFFLLEPSMFSQYMALGLAIEMLVLQRIKYIALLLVGLMVSSAGTGWLILASFIVALAVGMKSRGVVLALTMVVLLGLALAVLAVAAPDFAAAFFGRIGEFSAPGSSAHGRFIAPFWLLEDVVWRAPWMMWAGLGPGISERLVGFTYDVSLNTPIKILIEFGMPAMITYLVMLTVGLRTRSQTILLVPGLVMLLLTGAYAQVPPMLDPILLIICIPTLLSSQASQRQTTSILPHRPSLNMLRRTI